MRELRQIAFLVDDFTLLSPAQQLLDRFLVGFPENGAFQRSQTHVAVWTPKAPGLLEQRKRDFGLVIAPDPAAACRQADAIVVVGAGKALFPDLETLRRALEFAPEDTPIFVHGLLSSSPATAAEVAQLAQAKRCPLHSGTALPFAFRLPDVDVPGGTILQEALIIVQGEFPAAELDGLEGLLPLLEQRRPRSDRGTGIARLRYLDEEALWRAGQKGDWSWSLFEAAISRSHTPQGNAVLDGRTEDLAGLGLAPKLARHPRGWIVEHADELHSTVLVLDGVVADSNFAVSTAEGDVISAQLFRTPPPQQEQYSRLVAALRHGFTSGNPEWSLERGLTEVKLIAAMNAPKARSGDWIKVGS